MEKRANFVGELYTSTKIVKSVDVLKYEITTIKVGRL
jgi:hypothetical protein